MSPGSGDSRNEGAADHVCGGSSCRGESEPAGAVRGLRLEGLEGPMDSGIFRVGSVRQSFLAASAIGLLAWLPGSTFGQDWPQSYRGVWGGTQVQPPESAASYICLLGGGLGDTVGTITYRDIPSVPRSEEHTSELQSRLHLVCRLL